MACVAAMACAADSLQVVQKVVATACSLATLSCRSWNRLRVALLSCVLMQMDAQPQNYWCLKIACVDTKIDRGFGSFFAALIF